MTQQLLFITCIPGLEPILENEINQLGYIIKSRGFGGVFLPYTDFRQIYALNLLLRTASRVLFPLAYFDCRDKEDLYRQASRIDWAQFFQERGKRRAQGELLPTVAIDANVQHKAFPHSLYAAQVVKDAICDQLRKKLGDRPNVKTANPDVQINLFIQNEYATISFDMTGLPLHRRGYRLEGGEAPLRENLAAALILLSGYTSDKILLDPCCGSGTLLIEAAFIATKTPSQFMRETFGFMSHPEYSESVWQEIRRREIAKRIPLESGRFIGIEKDIANYTALQKAIKNAGFEEKIVTMCSDFRTAKLPFQPNLIIANPPYGKRIQDQEVGELSALYKDLGNFMKANTVKPGRGFILSGDMELTKKIGLHASRRHIVNNAGIECRFLEYDLY